jgi:chromate reductase, NAD(P)H dehydrogenase (quinone)
VCKDPKLKVSMKKKILAISGSTRANSSNEAILKYIKHKWADVLDVELYNELDKLPHFNPDVNDENINEYVKKFRSSVDHANGVIICTPEYVFSLPGALKNAIEWSVSTTIFSDKPLVMIVASGLGEKTFESLSLIMQTVGAKMTDESRVLISGARAKLNSEGKLSDEISVAKIEAAISSLISLI